MLLAVDVHYQANRAHVAGVAFERWSSSRPQAVYCSAVKRAQAYVPGEFYKPFILFSAINRITRGADRRDSH